MKRTFIYAILLCLTAIACNKTEEQPIATQKEISTGQAGMLSSLLTEDEMRTLTELFISGPLNGSDIRVLRTMSKNYSLSILNLKDASIVAGGNAYHTDSDGTSYYTIDNDLSTRIFTSCKALTSIVLPQNLKIIGDEAFQNCSKLSHIEWFEGLDSIGEGAFSNTALTGDILLPKSLRTIGRRAFFQNNQIQKVIIQSDITVPKYGTLYAVGGNSPFAYCEQLMEVVVNEGCTKLEIGFQNCTALSSVTLPNSLTHLGALSSTSCNYIFRYCENLHNITLPNRLQIIGENCFSYSGLVEIEIPESVGQIQTYAFSHTPLISMKVNWDRPLEVNRNIFKENDLEEATLYVPSGKKQLYSNHVTWGSFGNIIEESK